MGLNKYKMGQLIEPIFETNKLNLFGPDDVMGMTITKEVIPTKADLANTNLSEFIVVHNGDFIFNPRTHGKKIGFGYNNTGKPFIISWNNIAFRIKPNMAGIILPDYLFLHFNRGEWDREACFQSWGSSTEVFSWESLSDMQIVLPQLSVQQKYVDIYNAILKNQQCYERGLHNLLSVCDWIMDKLKHNSPKRKVGSIFREIDNRNADGLITEVKGINISKQFMPTVADMNDINLAKYKVVQKGQFAFSGMQTGRDKCIRIALSQRDAPFVISPAYCVFEISDSTVLPEYVMLWFSRKETDRMGWFFSDASVRSNLETDCFYDFEIPVPDFNTQQSIVNLFVSYNHRCSINENLKSRIRSICPILIKGSIEEAQKES